MAKESPYVHSSLGHLPDLVSVGPVMSLRCGPLCGSFHGIGYAVTGDAARGLHMAGLLIVRGRTAPAYQ